MSQTVPDFTTAIITILFLLILAGIGFVIKIKSGSLKKIIKKQEYLEILHHSPLRNGYLSYVFKVGEEKFFFVGHKSGRGTLTQVIKETVSEVSFENKNIINAPNNKINNNPSKLFKNEISERKPLQHVNISDLLSAHKKGGTNA
jgi:hypothetical protein